MLFSDGFLFHSWQHEADWVGWYQLQRIDLNECPARPVFAVHNMAKFNVWRSLVAESVLRESRGKARLGRFVVQDGTRGYVGTGWAHFCGAQGGP